MLDGSSPPRGYLEIALLFVIGLFATAVRLADDPPKTVARGAWLVLAGLGLATGGWVIAKALGLHGWPALAFAWVVGALGSETTLPVFRRWLDRQTKG